MRLPYLIIAFLFSLSLSLRITSLDEEARRDACKNFDLTYMDHFSTTTFHQYVTDLKLKYSQGDIFFLNLLLTGTIDNLKGLLDDLSFYLFFLALALVSLITWIVFCVCQCCQCCLFLHNVHKGKCGLVMFIISIILFSIILILTSIGFGESITFIKSFNGTTCSFLSFFSHALSGDNGTELPKWVGVKGVQLALKGASGALKVINDEYDTTFKNHNTKLVDPLEKYDKSIMDSQTKFNEDITGPNGGTIRPIYAKQFSSLDDPQYMLTSINNEYKYFLLPSVTILTSLRDISDAINKITTFSQDLSNLAEKFHDIELLIDDMINKLADNFIALQDNIASVIILIFNIIYGFFIALAISVIVFLSLYSFMKVFWLKYVIHIIWHICLLFIALCFIVGSFIGIIGFCGKKLIPAVDYILSPEYLTSPDSLFAANQATATNLNTCINGDGDLFTSMKGSKDNTDKLNVFYKLSIQMGDIETKLQELTNSAAVPKFQTYLDGYVNDMATSTDSSNNDDDVATAVKALNALTNKECSGTNDLYIIKKSDCPSDYTVYTSGTATTGNYCYMIDNSLTPKTYSPPCDSTIGTKITNLKTYVVDSLSKVNTMKQYLTSDFGTPFNNIMQEIKNEITNTKIMTNSLGSILEPIIGENEFYDMFNCRFIRVDLIIFVDQLFNNFCDSCQLVAIDCFINSLLAYITIYFLIKAIYHYSKEARELAESVDESDAKRITTPELPIQPIDIVSIGQKPK